MKKDRFLIGGPDQVIRDLRPFVEQYGATHLICRLFFPGMPHRHIMRELDADRPRGHARIRLTGVRRKAKQATSAVKAGAMETSG